MDNGYHWNNAIMHYIIMYFLGQGSMWYRSDYELWSCYSDYSWWQGPNRLWIKFHCLHLHGQKWCSGQRQLLRPQADHKEDSWCLWWPHKTGSIYWIIDDCQFGSIPGSQKEAIQSTDAIFVVWQLQEKYLAMNKRLYMAFVNPEKAGLTLLKM